jgi:hypothetical protein
MPLFPGGIISSTVTRTIRVIRPRNMTWEEYVARIRALRNACNILIAKPEEKRTL